MSDGGGGGWAARGIVSEEVDPKIYKILLLTFITLLFTLRKRGLVAAFRRRHPCAHTPPGSMRFSGGCATTRRGFSAKVRYRGCLLRASRQGAEANNHTRIRRMKYENMAWELVPFSHSWDVMAAEGGEGTPVEVSATSLPSNRSGRGS